MNESNLVTRFRKPQQPALVLIGSEGQSTPGKHPLPNLMPLSGGLTSADYLAALV